MPFSTVVELSRHEPQGDRCRTESFARFICYNIHVGLKAQCALTFLKNCLCWWGLLTRQLTEFGGPGFKSRSSNLAGVVSW